VLTKEIDFDDALASLVAGARHLFDWHQPIAEGLSRQRFSPTRCDGDAIVWAKHLDDRRLESTPLLLARSAISEEKVSSGFRQRAYSERQQEPIRALHGCLFYIAKP
jgi:hypothetical protein